MSGSPPTTLGKYQIIREIARSNDIVYEGYDPLMNRRVAIKELAVPNGATPQQKEERLKRFHREAKAAGSLAHPNIVTIYEVGEEASRHFLAMEYLDGHTLRNEIDTHGFLPQERAIEIAVAVLLALDYAHQNGVVHRDIKPDNIQLLSDGRIKLTDFGIARLTFEPNLTMDGQVFGTPSYMSPEQVVGRDIDARSDLFSVGVLLYEMMSGQKPFQGDSVVSITYAIMNKEPDPPAQINHSLWQVISRALDKSPALRYASAKEMIAALDQAQCHNGMVLDPVTPTIMGNPYAAPTGNPYMTPAPPQPPINYPFNPYQNPPQQPLPPQTGMPQPPFQIQNLPTHVYYPPPPRQPLLKPEQKAFLSRLFLTFVILGTFFLLFVVALLYYSGRLAVRERISTPPAVERIVSRQSQVGGVPTLPEDRVADQEMSRTADALVESGMQSLNAAQNSHYASDAVENFLRAAEDFEWAAKLSDGSRRQNFQSLAARSYLNAAQLLRELQRFADARECIYAARRCAPEDSDEAAVAQSLIEQFG